MTPATINAYHEQRETGRSIPSPRGRYLEVLVQRPRPHRVIAVENRGGKLLAIRNDSQILQFFDKRHSTR